MSYVSEGIDDDSDLTVGSDLGPELKDFADGSAPVKEILASLQRMSDTIKAWKPRANQKLWGERIATVARAILDARALVKPKDVFATKKGRAAYETALKQYARVKGMMESSPDVILTLSQQAASEPLSFKNPFPSLPTIPWKPILITLGVAGIVIGGGYYLSSRNTVKRLSPIGQ